MFTLCIPTMDRFDKFLKHNIPKYIDNKYIDEIIITDENGNDFEQIKNYFEHPKIKLFKNDKILGPFLNKINVLKKAKNEWVALIDSDNYVDEKYFSTVINYMLNKNIIYLKTILSPMHAMPNFNYSDFSGMIFKKGNGVNCINYKDTKLLQLINTGNYVINKSLVNDLNLIHESSNIIKSSACDVVYFNTLLFEQVDLHFHVVPDLKYYHCVHSGSIYLNTIDEYREFSNSVYDRFYSLNFE